MALAGHIVAAGLVALAIAPLLAVERAAQIPLVAGMHIVLAVTDHGTPRLTRYARVRVNVVAPTQPGVK